MTVLHPTGCFTKFERIPNGPDLSPGSDEQPPAMGQARSTPVGESAGDARAAGAARPVSLTCRGT
ncbi:hypothetical protein GCM10010156_53030 [Planobispora rosea]|uniref:Uncharacterized protein n=1 Tax=Planobispora rosea TaxID=35762 RepID=A0A8J3SF45_PLARO|nr:hypothetical protein GCM10010156_53030 [Planobispora rosea]GIH88573.1 hypothetical protein Pro02_69810 [Planobispora rosea]